MENPNKKLLTHSLIFGLVLSGILIVLQLMTYILELDIFSIAYSLTYQLLTIIVIVWIMAYACVKFRNTYLDNNISFLKCFMIGLIVGLCASIIISFYSYIFNVFFDPEYANGILEKAVEKIDTDPRIPDSQKEMIIMKMQEGFSPVGQLVRSLITTAIMNTILALIATLFVRKKEKLPETNIY